MAYLLDSNLLIYSADAAYASLRPLVQNSANYASAISQVETLGFYHLALMDSEDFQAGNFTTKFLESFDFSVV